LRSDEGDSDRGALIALYEACGGPGWRESENWRQAPGKAATPINFWFGVAVKLKRATALELSDNGLRGSLDGACQSLTALRRLRIVGAYPLHVCAATPAVRLTRHPP
jgi:hypothetical protein